MFDFLNHLLDAPFANILIVAGLIFLGIGAVGKISGKIEPGIGGRIMCGVLGLVLLVVGIQFHSSADKARDYSTKESPSGPPQVPQPKPQHSEFSGEGRTPILTRAASRNF